MSQYRQSPFANIPPVVKNLLIINIIFYLAEWVLQGRFDMVDNLGTYYFDSPDFRPWQIITYMFIHDMTDPGHIFGNMFALFIFGPTLEYTMGSKRFFNFYFICGIGALLMQMGTMAFEMYFATGSFTLNNIHQMLSFASQQKIQEIYTTVTFGASGAIFGILLAFGVLFPNVEMMIIPIPVPIKAKYLIGAYVLFEIYSAFHRTGDHVAHFAHIGGALVAFILIKIWGLRAPRQFF